MEEDKGIFEKYSKDFTYKLIEIVLINSIINFHTPHIIRIFYFWELQIDLKKFLYIVYYEKFIPMK